MSNTVLFLFRHSHQSFLIPWPTGSEWHCFIYQAVSSMINREWVTLLCFISLPTTSPSHDHRWWVLQSVLPIASGFIAPHPVTNSQWVVCHLCQSLLFISPTESEWACSCFSYHLTTNRLCVIQLLMTTSHYISNRKWVGLHFMSNTVHQLISHDQ